MSHEHEYGCVICGESVHPATPDRADLRARIEAAVAEAERARIRALGPEFRRVITNAYYDTRNEGGTMETAADRAVAAVLAAIDGPASAEPGPDGETK